MNLKQAVKEVLGVREVFGTDEWPCRCFNPDHHDATPSASINVAKGLWVCYSCGRGGRVEDLLDGRPIAPPGTSDLLLEAEALLDSMIGIPTRSESWLLLYTGPVHPYWVSRDIEQATADFWGLGYDYQTKRVTYPLRDAAGRLLGVVERALDDAKPKYRYPSGINVHDLLFGYHCLDVGPEVVLVEGALDVIALWEAGIPALGIYGSRLSEHQAQLIRRLERREVIFAFDQDKAGEAAVRHAVTFDLAPVMSTCEWCPDEAKDVAELSVWRRREVVAHAVLAA